MSMKDIMSKLASLEATAPKTTDKKMLNEDSTTPPMNVSDKPASLKDVFEAMAMQKPIPVVGKQGDTQQTGAGFLNVTDTSPAAQALGNALGDLVTQKKVQIVMPTQGQKAGQPAPAGATGQPQQGQMQMKEKWDAETKVSPSEKGKYEGKSKAELTKAYNKLKASGPHKKGSPEFGKMRELAFAIRAKSDWGKVQEEDMDEGAGAKDWHDDMEQWALNKGRKNTGSKSSLERAADRDNDWALSHRKSDTVKEEQLDELSPETIRSAQAKRYGQLNQLAQTGAARAGSTTSFNAKASPQTINQFHDTETKAINRDFNDQQRTSAKYDPAERDAALASNERNRTRNMSRGNMLNVANKKLQGTANVPAKSVAEGAKVDRMVKHIAKSERKLGKSKDEAEDIAWATANKRGMLDNKNKKKVKEGDIAPTDGIDTRGAGLGAGRSDEVLEGKKPDFLDLDKDGNKKEPMKKAAADKKKKKVDESMNHRISAARFEGKSHGLKGHAHCGKSYEDLEERKAYCEGYKDGLDECYGMGVYETAMPATVPGMADAAMDEGNAFTAALARTPKGGKFSVGGKTFTDRTGYDAKIDEYAFESLDNQLNALLESEDLSEGLSVSVSKGQQNSPDSVTITAQDAEADQLLQLVKHAGLGLFGDDHAEPSSAMSVQPDHGAPDEVGAGGAEIDVVDDSDGMLALMKKLGGVEAAGAEDHHEEACDACGEADCSCDSEQVDEVESEDQQEFEVAEDNAPDSGAEDSVADEDAEAKEDAALAGADSKDEEEVNESFFDLLGKLTNLAESKDEDEDYDPEEDGPDHGKAWNDTSDELKEGEGEEEEEEDDGDDFFHNKKVAKDKQLKNPPKEIKIDEWANQVGKGPGKGTDASFEQDIEFMTKVIAGGLNKPKSTGQTTIPVIAHQDDRTHDNPADWATLAGIKKS